MEWFKSGAGQLIALVTIIGTLAGFGYTGATYVNRLENLEKKIIKQLKTWAVCINSLLIDRCLYQHLLIFLEHYKKPTRKLL